MWASTGINAEKVKEIYKQGLISNKVFQFCCSCCSVVKLCLTLLRPHGVYPARLLCPWDFPGKNTGVGYQFLLQGSSQPRDGTRVSYLADRVFTIEPPGKPTNKVAQLNKALQTNKQKKKLKMTKKKLE